MGAALGAKISGSDQAALTFFGDGATNQGTFHESLNLAALWKLPVIFFCENNQYAEMTPVWKGTSIERLADRGCAYGIPGVVVDGNDVEAVYRVTAEAAARARAGAHPYRGGDLPAVRPHVRRPRDASAQSGGRKVACPRPAIDCPAAVARKGSCRGGNQAT